MLNLYEDIKSKSYYNKFEIGGLLFAEYNCPIRDKFLDIWTHIDYLVHVISGKKIWHTTSGSMSAEPGQTIFFKKGAAVVEQFFDEDFCLLIFFIPDNFVIDIVKELAPELPENKNGTELPEVLRVNNDILLKVFFQSMLAYFSGTEKPSEEILKLKLKELILSILVGKNNPVLASYFCSVFKNQVPKLSEIMETNYRYNLSIENYAEMCHRSLSSFKRDFMKHFEETPGKWLLRKRLEYSAMLLRSGNQNISQVVFESGFENQSHFTRAFKSKYGLTPLKFRNQTANI